MIKKKLEMAKEALFMGTFFRMATIGVFTFAEILRPFIYSLR